jgi:tRNA A-37 threonylcarbamoyl transferase component Bud32
MNKESALARLGISGSEDPTTIARAYGERLSAVQDQLVSAQTDADRQLCRQTLSDLVEAYELVTGTGRHTSAPANDDSATVRSAGDAGETMRTDTIVRMEPGAVLSSRLEVGEMLGSGGMGVVYAARDRLKKEDVAIKVLRQDLLFSAAAKDRFLAEAKVSCHLSHPNIVRVHDVGVSGSHYYLSMERLKGQTLRHRIEAYYRDQRQFAIHEVTDIARQLIDALRYAHRFIVHRDLKPENVWLAEDGTVKLMDFGIARAFTQTQLTQTGVTLGTAYYMAPEQRAAAKEVDWRADQYSLGVMLYELLAGTLPTGAVQPLEEIRKDVPKKYARALMRAMSPKPDDRFGSLNELLAEIEAPVSTSRAGVGGLLLIAAGVAAAAAGVFFAVKRPSPPEPTQETTAAAAAPVTAAPAPVANVEQASGDSGPPPPTQPPEETQVAATLPPADSGAKPVEEAVEEEAPPPAPATTPVAAAPSKRVATVDTSRSDDRRQQCLTQCDRDSGECRSINRRSKQDCMRAVAFNGTGRLSTTNAAAAECAFYGAARCDHAYNREACLARISARHASCVEVIGGSIATRRQDCEQRSHDSDQLCLDELRECRASCEG